MSIRVMSSLWDLELNPTVKLVLLALADCANDEGLAWPSIATLARKASVGERTVQRSLVEARALGIINREEVIGRGCKYTFTPFTPRHAGTPATVSPVTNDAQTPATVAPHPRHAGTQSVIETLEPSKEIVENANPILKPEHVIEAYNELAERKGLRKAIKITDERKRKLALAVKRNTVAEFQEALAAIERSKFLCGENDRGWRADFDFLLQPKTFTKLIEGCYG